MQNVWRLLVIVAAAGVLLGCNKRTGEAVVLEKEYIAAREVMEPAAPETTLPSAEQSPVSEIQEEARQMAPDEVAVGQHVMKAADRGTARDPRALKDEQWLVTVQTVEGGRRFTVPANQAQFESVKEGEVVRIKFHLGKYTGTVWSAEITNLPRR